MQDPLPPSPPGKRPSDVYTLEGTLPGVGGGEDGAWALLTLPSAVDRAPEDWIPPSRWWAHPSEAGRRVAPSPGGLAGRGTSGLLPEAADSPGSGVGGRAPQRAHLPHS